MEISNKILELRKQKNITQEQLAELMDVARQTISGNLEKLLQILINLKSYLKYLALV